MFAMARPGSGPFHRAGLMAAGGSLEASVMTGMEMGDDDLLRLLDVSTWRSRRDEFEEHSAHGALIREHEPPAQLFLASGALLRLAS